MTPIVRLRRSARLRATGSGRYPSSATALRTACRFSSLTRVEFCNTRETRDFDTPARAATVRMVGGRSGAASVTAAAPDSRRHVHGPALVRSLVLLTDRSVRALPWTSPIRSLLVSQPQDNRFG